MRQIKQTFSAVNDPFGIWSFAVMPEFVALVMFTGNKVLVGEEPTSKPN